MMSMNEPVSTVANRTRVSGVSGRSSFEEFFSAEHRGLYGALVLVTRSSHEAEEVMQDAFLRVWERWDRVAALDDPVGYLYRTAMNLFRSRRRRVLVALRRTVKPREPDDASASSATAGSPQRRSPSRSWPVWWPAACGRSITGPPGPSSEAPGPRVRR